MNAPKHADPVRIRPRLLLATALLLGLAVLSVASLPVLMDRAGGERGPNAEFIETQMVRAGGGYATAKAVNALVSLAQSVEIGFSLGVFVNVSPAEVLDPVNDMAETVANAFLLALGALTLERVLLEINYWLAFGLLVPVSLGLMAGGLWGLPVLLGVGIRLLAAGMIIGVVLPLSIQASRVLDATILAGWSDGAHVELQRGEQDLLDMQERLKDLSRENFSEAAPEQEPGQEHVEPQGWLDFLHQRLRAAMEGAGRALDVERPGRLLEAMLPQIEARADALLSRFISLLVSIVVNTLVIPLATLFALWTLMRSALTISGPVSPLPRVTG